MHYVFVSSTLQFWCKVMPSIKLTETFLKSTDRPSTGTVRYWDSEIKGFVAHVQKTTTTFYYDRDNRRHLIGKFPTVRLERAREAARDLDYRLRRGYARHVTQSNPMIREMMEQYVARPTLRSDVYRKAVRQAVEIDFKWAQKRVLDITPEMCRDMHRKLGKRGPVAANGIMQSFNTVWNYFRRMDRNLPESPAAGLEWFPGKKSLNAPIRDLVAWKQEVERIENHVHRAAYMLALFTGLRRSEIESLEWDRVGDEIHLPQTKVGREFWLPLTDVHHRILLSVRGLDARWVFPSYGKSGHIECWNHKHVPGTLHSLRHTFATVGVEAGIPEEVIGRLLNHASKTITGQRYVKPKLDFLRTAMQVVVEELERRTQVDQPGSTHSRPLPR
jgi:site-specific recombinase XerC